MAEEVARWMDQRLDSLLAAFGIAEEDVQWTSLLTRVWEQERWDMRVLEVKLPLGLSLDQVADALDSLRVDVSHTTHIMWITETKGLRTADLWVDGFLTHRILLKEPPVKPPAAVSAPRRPQIALIVDDLGNMYDPIRPLFQMKAPFTVSVFPNRPFSRQIAEEARSRGLEVMMHLPMEPWGYPDKNPGGGALLVDMSEHELERVLLKDIQDLPHVRGVNNHMGSRFTEDPTRMVKVMTTLAAKGLYFVDSLTTPRSVGYRLAMEMGMHAYKRDVFLDVVQDEVGIRSQFEKLLKVAVLQGYAVGICHPYPETIRILPEFFKQADDEGFEWVTVSRLRSSQADLRHRVSPVPP